MASEEKNNSEEHTPEGIIPENIATYIGKDGGVSQSKYDPNEQGHQEFGSSHSIIGVADTHDVPTNTPAQTVPNEATRGSQRTWSMRKGETPESVLGDSINEGNALKAAMDKYWEVKTERGLDSRDIVGRDQSKSAPQKMAELKKIAEYVSKQVDKAKKKDQRTNKEIELLLQEHLNKNRSYASLKDTLDNSSLSKAEKARTLKARFSKEIEDYTKDVSKRNLNKDEMDVIRKHYQKELIAQHNKQAIADDFKDNEARRLRKEEYYKDNNNVEYEKRHLNDFTRTTPTPLPLVDSVRQQQEAEQQEADQAKERKNKQIALIATVAGGIGGVGTALAVGASAVPPIRTAAIVGTIASTVVSFGTKIGANILQRKIDTETDPEKKAKLEKTKKLLDKISHGARIAGAALGSFALGLWGGSLISSHFHGGHGLLFNKAPETLASNQPAANDAMRNTLTQTGGGTSTPSPSGNVIEAGSTNFDTGLISNGRINLPGSTWNGNLASGPTGTLPGGETLYSNYSGGQFNMAAFQFNKDLAEAGLKVTDLTEKVGTGGVHRLLNGYLNAIRGGATNPDLLTVLKDTSLTGAEDIISMIS